MKKMLFSLFLVVALLLGSVTTAIAAPDKLIGVNVVLNTDINDDILVELGMHGKVRDLIPAIDALTMQVRESNLDTIRALPFVAAANPDAERNGAPVDTLEASNFLNGRSTWNLDAVNVTDFGLGRTEVFDGTGVYVAVLDTGLVDSWRQFFPQERIATEFAKSFGGGGGEVGNVSEQPNKWEHDQNSHGTHVTSTIIGYNLNGAPVNGVAPMATIIPVKVLNQNGSGWSSVVAQGITYIADLKKDGKLGDSSVVINMSLGGSVLDAIEQAAIDYAIEMGVIIVASAGNEGTAGMGYPGAYPPVISVAASGWVKEWTPVETGSWWWNLDVDDPTNPYDFYIADFSSRAVGNQDLDVAAPGSLIVGPYKVNSGIQTSFYYLSGTSMASPHVAGIVALMVQKNPSLKAAAAEGILETSAIALPGWGTDATGAGLATANAALAATP